MLVILSWCVFHDDVVHCTASSVIQACYVLYKLYIDSDNGNV